MNSWAPYTIKMINADNGNGLKIYGNAENINICMGVKNKAKRSITVVDGNTNNIRNSKEFIAAIASKIVSM